MHQFFFLARHTHLLQQPAARVHAKVAPREYRGDLAKLAVSESFAVIYYPRASLE